MAEKETQRHAEEFTIPAAYHHASSQDDTIPVKKQSRWTLLTLANLLCLAVAVMYIWSTHDLVGFILLYGIATGAINAREVVGIFNPKRLSDPIQIVVDGNREDTSGRLKS